ncbi:hypothetical protein [Egicoccus sp. AB-alg2]|uniref:hypothetical protein n=1 Tax=Egicoccus sp. AB-alg2 TaxID=3242693 RepID=UPI00359DF149
MTQLPKVDDGQRDLDRTGPGDTLDVRDDLPRTHRPGPRRLAVLLLALLLAACLAESAVRQAGDAVPTPPTWGTTFTDAKVRQMQALGGVETVVLGSSIANGGLAPEALQRDGDTGPTYNAAIPGSGVTTWRLWSEQVVLPLLEPRRAVIGVSVRDFNDHQTDGGYARLTESPGYQLATGSASTERRVEAWFAQRSDFVRKRSALREPAKVLAWSRGEEVQGWTRPELLADGRYDGFDDNRYNETERLDRSLREDVFVDYAPGPVNVTELTGLVRAAQERGIEVTVVRMPAMEERMVTRGLLPETAVDGFDRALRAVTADTGAAYVDLSDLNDDEALFADYYHLREAGIRAVNQRVAQALAAG